MPRGAPDYGLYAPKDTTASISDMGEVAARLGSIVTFDKRGDVVDFDNFEDAVLKWAVIISNPACYARLDSTHVRSGSQSVRLHTAATNLWLAGIEKFTRHVGTKRLGVETSFSNVSYNCYIYITMQYYDATWLHEADLRITPNTGALALWVPPGAWVTIATLGQILNDEHLFYTLKMVVDFDTDKYLRLLYSQHEYDVSAHSLYTELSPVTPFLRTRIRIENIGAFANDGWMEDFVYTQAEP